MKVRLIGVACVVSVLLIAGSANSGDLSSEMLLSSCKASLRISNVTHTVNDGVPAGMCSGYVAGVLNGYETATEIINAASQQCSPKCTGFLLPWNIPLEVKQNQIIRVVVKYLEEHPEQMHEPAALNFVRALSSAFPRK